MIKIFAHTSNWVSQQFASKPFSLYTNMKVLTPSITPSCMILISGSDDLCQAKCPAEVESKTQ